MPAPKIKFHFDSKIDEARKVADDIAASLVTGITKETEQNIRNMIARAIDEGVTPYDAARQIKASIGLTSAQGQAVMKYHDQLSESGLTSEQVNDQVERYAARLLNRRAETIARTEIMDALNEGKQQSWLQAQEQGFLSPAARKEVINDSDACEICRPLNGQSVPLDEEFSEGDPPFHPNCRCTVGISTP